MAKKIRGKPESNQVPVVSIACPTGRPFQLRYFCVVEKRQIRVSTGTRDAVEAEKQRRELEARLLLGLEAKKSHRKTEYGPEMSWGEFRELFSTLHLSTVRESSAIHAESRLDLAERILRPKKLGDVATATAMQQLQAGLLTGAESRRGMPRSPHTVKGYLNSVLSAVNWAFLQGWIPSPVRFRKLKTGRLKGMKGRPLSSEEFALMLSAVPAVVGQEAAPSWSYLLRGLWESAFRLGELMNTSWDIPRTIRPIWKPGQSAILHIPAAMQKNGTDDDIPMLPGLEKLLLETPLIDRKGWVFKPSSLQSRLGRSSSRERPEADWVGKVIGKIGREAGIVVDTEDPVTGRPAKYASAHDLRRSCAERLRNLGVPPLVICRVMRHSSWETTRKHYAPGDVQQDAKVLRELLDK